MAHFAELNSDNIVIKIAVLMTTRSKTQMEMNQKH